MRAFRCAVAVVALVALTGASRTQKAPPPPPPHVPAVAPGEQSRILDLGPLVVRIPIGTKIGRFTCDPNIQSPDFAMEQSTFNLDPSDYRPAFFDPAQAEGYRVTQSQTSVFGSAMDKGTDAELVVGGAVTDLYVENCAPRAPNERAPRGSITGALGLLGALRTPHVSARMSVTWEVFDPLERKVLLKTTTSGEVDVPRAPSPMTAFTAAFGIAAQHLLVDPEFHRIAMLPRSVPQGAAPDPASANANVAISRTALSTTPFQQHADKVLGEVVTVLLGGGHGSGFYISDTLLLTNQHVVGLSQYVKVRLKSGKEMVGEVLSRDAGRDVALVKTESIGSPGLPVRTEDPGIGSQVYVIGTPLQLGLAESVSSGIVSGFRTRKNYKFIQSEANVQHGNSGGPMLDDKGNVIGLTDLGVPADDGTNSGIGLFIPIGDALRSLNVTFAGG